MISRFITEQAVALALLTVPVFAANLSNYTYLALGDSIPFGYDPTVTTPTPNSFTGYPELVAQADHLLTSKKEVNASCPGQTSSSFLDAAVPDNGCLEFKDLVGLRVAYPDSESQLQFAVTQISGNKHIDLVTLSIGGNDLLLLQQECDPGSSTFTACVATLLPGVLTVYGQNLGEILAGLRTEAKYGGQIILVTQYSPSTDPLFTAVVEALNSVTDGAAAQFGATIADGFTAFQVASAPFGGDPCAAGLLIRIDATTCYTHPSPAGQELLASAVLSVMTGK